MHLDLINTGLIALSIFILFCIFYDSIEFKRDQKSRDKEMHSFNKKLDEDLKKHLGDNTEDEEK